MKEPHYKDLAQQLVERYMNISKGGAAFPIEGLYLNSNIFYFVKGDVFSVDEKTCGDADAVTFYTSVSIEATILLAEINNVITAPLPQGLTTKKSPPKSVIIMANELMSTLNEILVVSPSAVETSFTYYEAQILVTLRTPRRFRLTNKPSDDKYAHAVMLATKMLINGGSPSSSTAPQTGTAMVKKSITILEPRERVLELAKAAYEKGMYSKEHFPIFGVYVIFDTLNFTVPPAYEKHPFLGETCTELNKMWSTFHTELKDKKSVFTQYELFREMGVN